MNQKTVVSSIRNLNHNNNKAVVSGLEKNEQKDLAGTQENKKSEKEIVEKSAQDKNQNATHVSNWMLALGLGALVAVTVASTVYYVKRKRYQKARLAYTGEEENETVESYQEKFNRYWGLTVRLFTGVKTSVLNVLSKEKDMPPTHSSTKVNMKNYGSASDNGYILDEAEL